MDRINGRRNSTNRSIASLSILFCMRKRSNARTGIPTGGNAGEDEDSRYNEADFPANGSLCPAFPDIDGG
jgi:hypothetical protein